MKPVLIASLSICMLASASAQRRKPRQYKRVHQRAIKQLTNGKLEQALTDMQAFAEKHPKDAETQFLLTVLHAQAGHLDRAVASMRSAMRLGLPSERFVAGPRELLAPLRAREEYRALVDEWRGRPLHGPMIGSVTDSSARFWVRTAIATDVRVEVFEVGREEVAGKGKARSSPDRDFTAVVEVAGLRPDTPYRFVVTVGDRQPRRQERQRFRTAPKAGASCRFTLAFGGGSGYVPDNERVWNTIAKLEPRLLLLLGDNVYIDAPKIPAMQTYCYYRRQSRTEFRDLLAHTPVYSIWDDHDFGTNDCSGGPEIRKPAWKPRVWRTFRDNWVNPAYGGGATQPGVWYSFSFGDVDFFMLDGRYYREKPKPPRPERSMLGPVQRAWLQRAVIASKATFKVLCSPVPWDYRTKGKSKDTWNGFRKEREEILASLEAKGVGGVLLVSADRHRSDAWKLERPDGYDLYEFNSSRLTNQHVHPTMKQAIFSYNAKQSFGLIHFDTKRDDPTATYDVMTIDGEKVHSLTVKRSQLDRGNWERRR